MHRYVVLADRVKGFDTWEEAEAYTRANYPAVLCERRQQGGESQLVEIARNDFLFDRQRAEWRVFFERRVVSP